MSPKTRDVDLKGRFDGVLFGLVVVLAAISVMLLFSIRNAQGESEYWKKQMLWQGLGLMAMVGVSS